MSIWICAVLSVLLTAGVYAETVAVEKSRLVELERQAARVTELERELSATRAELARLKKSSAARPPAWVPPAVEQAAAQAPPTPALATLPALADGAVVSVHDLLNHFASEPAGAEARYAGRKLRVRGVVAQLDKVLFTSPYLVIFRLPGQSLALECSVAPEASFTKVYVTGDRERVVGERGNQRVTLATVGAEVMVEGRCSEGKGGVIRLTQARLLPVP